MILRDVARAAHCRNSNRQTVVHSGPLSRRAGAKGSNDPRVRQNLALVVGLQGRFEEAQTIARADLPPDEAAANVAYLRQMMSQPNNWSKLARPGEAARPGGRS